MKTKTPRNLVRVAKAFDAAAGDIVVADTPLLEREEPHKVLGRATKRHFQLTEELRTLKSDFAAENVRAQQTRTSIPTSRITFVETRRRDLHLQLEMAQAEIGRLNKEIRERKALHQGNGAKPEPRPPAPKPCPVLDDPRYPEFFLLAARDALTPSLFAEVERMAKSLMHQAKKMGL
jgi:hypothetical protein